MAVVERFLPQSPEVVFAVLADPWTYPEWLVGAREMRSVDAGFPAPGRSFHHRVGLVGPLTVNDSSTCLEVEDGRRLVLEVRARPLGRGRVEMLVEPQGPGTVVRFDEVPLGVLAPTEPVIAPLTRARNHASLDALARLLEAGEAP